MVSIKDSFSSMNKLTQTYHWNDCNRQKEYKKTEELAWFKPKLDKKDLHLNFTPMSPTGNNHEIYPFMLMLVDLLLSLKVIKNC